jgi:putative oxidoreductase
MKHLFPNRIAEIIYACVLLAFGFLHYKSAGDITAVKSVPSFMPGGGAFWLYFTAIAFVAAAVAIIINKFKWIACYSLAAMLFIFILCVHLKPFLDNPYNVIQPLKDVGLAMGAIFIANNVKHKH